MKSLGILDATGLVAKPRASRSNLSGVCNLCAGPEERSVSLWIRRVAWPDVRVPQPVSQPFCRRIRRIHRQASRPIRRRPASWPPKVLVTQAGGEIMGPRNDLAEQWGAFPSLYPTSSPEEDCCPYAIQQIKTPNRTFRPVIPKTPSLLKCRRTHRCYGRHDRRPPAHRAPRETECPDYVHLLGCTPSAVA